MSIFSFVAATRLLRRCAVGACLLIGAAAAADAADAAKPDAALQRAVQGEWRSADNRSRDRYRHPAETLAFFNARPESALIEITPGQGWYAEILAPLLRDRGRYTAAIVAPDKGPQQYRQYMERARTALQEKFAAQPALYAKARLVEFDPAAPVFGEPDSADVVVTFRNVHNWVPAGTAAAHFRAFYTVLKPGGVLGVEDHRAAPGAALNAASGYLPEDYVIGLATAAGFVLEARSEINANPADTKDYPQGVWTLPPTLRLGETDKAKYLAIGESDRFTLRFVKPASR